MGYPARRNWKGVSGMVSLKAAVHSFVLDLSNELREGVNWRAVILTLVLLAGAGGVAWLAGSSDPRYHRLCSRPSDTEIVLFMSMLPFLAGATLCAIGELMLWSRDRKRGRRDAVRHLWRAAVCLVVAALLGALAAWRLNKLCL